jgi:hypothetical protein
MSPKSHDPSHDRKRTWRLERVSRRSRRRFAQEYLAHLDALGRTHHDIARTLFITPQAAAKYEVDTLPRDPRALQEMLVSLERAPYDTLLEWEIGGSMSDAVHNLDYFHVPNGGDGVSQMGLLFDILAGARNDLQEGRPLSTKDKAERVRKMSERWEQAESVKGSLLAVRWQALDLLINSVSRSNVAAATVIHDLQEMEAIGDELYALLLNGDWIAVPAIRAADWAAKTGNPPVVAPRPSVAYCMAYGNWGM